MPDTLRDSWCAIDEQTSASDLVVAARGAHPDAWPELVHRFEPLLGRITRGFRLSEADREDVIQTTWVACLVSLHRLREPAALPGWLTTTCRRECLSVLGRAAQCVPVPDVATATAAHASWVHGEAPAGDPVQAVLDAEETRSLGAAVALLPERQRRIVQALCEAPGPVPSYQELAASLSMPIGSIGPTRQRAVERLRRQLTAADPAA